jgi:hypothetical protein
VTSGDTDRDRKDDKEKMPPKGSREDEEAERKFTVSPLPS